MKTASKILSVVLAVLMVLTVIPVVAFAAKEDDEARVAAWNENYQLVLDELFDNDNYVSWKYVDQNKKAIDDTMAVYTAFALYDNAWINYASRSLEKEDAKQILLGLIEKADYTFNDGYVDEIVKVLEGAQDVNDFIQKVNDFAKLDVFESDAWGTTFEVIGDVVKIANAYQQYRDEFIEAYARVLSVQMANAYYIDMLQYIVDNTEYAILKTAAEELIADINKSVEDAVTEILAKVAEDGASIGAEYLLKLAANSNAYTAVALKVYQGAVSVADVLWNTDEQYPLIDTVKTAYYYQSDIAAWAADALATDAEKALVAVNTLIAARKISEQALYNLKLAENKGAINKIKNRLYGTVYNDIEVNVAALDTIRTMLFATEIADMKPVVRVLTIYCPVDVELMNGETVNYVIKDGAVVTETNEYGVFASVYSEYAKTYHKIAFLYDACRVRLVGKAEGYVTLIMDALKDGKVEDWSFTDRKVNDGTKITFDTDYTGTPYYVSNDSTALKTNFNDKFVPSEQPEVSVKEVIEVSAEVGKEEAKSFIDKIIEFFQNIIEKILSIFSK